MTPLLDGVTYIMCGHFTTQLAKYPLALNVKSSNKVYKFVYIVVFSLLKMSKIYI